MITNKLISSTMSCQTELIVAIHDMLAEFGVCCASATGEEEEGTFLKLAIKHLLNLDMKLKSNFHSTCKEFEMSQCDKQSNHDNNVQKSEQLTHESHVNVLSNLSNLEKLNVEAGQVDRAEATVSDKVAVERISAEAISSRKALEVEKTTMEDSKNVDDISDSTYPRSANFKDQLVEDGTELSEVAKEELEFAIDNALDQCFYCLYGLNLRSDASYEDDLGEHKNTSRGDYQTKEQCADVFQYILPYAKASSVSAMCLLFLESHLSNLPPNPYSPSLCKIYYFKSSRFGSSFRGQGSLNSEESLELYESTFHNHQMMF